MAMAMLPLCTPLNDDGSARECILRKPIEVGRFSLDGQRKFHHDRHQMSCVDVRHQGNLRAKLDLNDGYGDRLIKRDEEQKSRLDNVLRWMLINKHRFVSTGTPKESLNSGDNPCIIGELPDFVLWRGHLTKMMCTPYENRDGWIMACQKFNHTVYISEVESEEATHKRRNMSERERLMTYWGVRFEGYMTGPFPSPGQREQVANIDQRKLITNTNKAFCSVLRSRLNQHHSLVFGAEVDCCQPVEVLNPPDCYIELKTSRIWSSQRQEDNFYRFKALKWWAQSYLCGIPTIKCGFRDDDGMVLRVDNFATLQLPTKASYLRNSWNPNKCLSFLDSILTSIKTLFDRERLDSESVLLLYWMPGDKGVGYEISNDVKDRFLPHWYTEAFI